MGNFFSSPDLIDDSNMKAINCCGTVKPNWKGMLSDWKKAQTETGWHKDYSEGWLDSYNMEKQTKCKLVHIYALSASRR
jgi:hypothetical protein